MKQIEDQSKKIVVLTGGGTAGHILPHFALLPLLQEKGWEAVYIGSKRGVDASIVRSMSDIPFHGITTGKLRRYFDIENFKDLFRIIAGFFQSLWILKKIRPLLIFSKGGFVSVPVVWAGWLLGIPSILHESDLSPGLANRMAKPFSKAICLSFPQSLFRIPSPKAIHTGLPVRSFLFEGQASRGRDLCGFDDKKKILLIMGGSLGSKAIDQWVWKHLPELLEHYQIAHVGKKPVEGQSIPSVPSYRFFEFVKNDLAHLYACAELVVSRAGANTLFELAALKKPALLIPLESKYSRGDQEANARLFAKLGLAELWHQESGDIENFLALLKKLDHNRDQYIQAMKDFLPENSGEKIVELMEKYKKKEMK